MKSAKLNWTDGRLSHASRIFLTGSTGVLGAQLLKELLLGTSATIYCLVRAETAENASRRLRTFLRTYDPDGALDLEFNQRVRPIAGEITQSDFGLSKEEYEMLTRTIDVVIHAAANTNLFLNYRRIEPINVGGTRNLINFTLQTRQKYLCYVSTYTVMGDRVFDPDFVFKEDDYDIGQNFEYMTYQKSKFTAEGLVRAAKSDGLIWNIIRPGQIFGESTTGNYPQGQANVIGLFYDIFKTVIETQVAFLSTTHFDVVPVDYVSQAIIELGISRDCHFQTYHLTNPDIKTYTEVIQLLAGLGYPISFVSQADYQKMLFERSLSVDGGEYKSPTTSAFKWWFKRENFDFGHSATTSCDKTRNALKLAGIECPRLNLDLMRTYINAGIKKGFFPEAKNQNRMVSGAMADLQTIHDAIEI